MQQSEHHGIPVLTLEGPAPLFGALVVQAGALDETFRTAQVSHVVEHLAHHTVPHKHLDHNASVLPGITVFHATGRPELVVGHLNAVAATLSNLPLEGLERELGVVEAEGGQSAHPALAVSAATRFGAHGPGILAGGAPADQLLPEHVRDFVGRFFVRGNAVLVFSGAVPDGLDVHLPEGPRHVRPEVAELPLALPATTGAPIPFPVLSYVLPAEQASSLVPQLLDERITQELRHTRGVSYSVEGDSVRLGDRVLVATTADGREGRERELAEALWTALRDLAAQGPSEEEMTAALARAAEEILDPRAVPDALVSAATALLTGRDPHDPEELLSLVRQASVEQVRDWAAGARDSALLLVPATTPDDKVEPLDGMPVLADPESARPVEGRVFRRKATALFAPGDLRAVAGDTGVSLTGAGHTWAAAWQDVVGVACTSKDREVQLRDGSSFHLCSRHLKDTATLFALIDEHVADRCFTVPEGSLH